MDGRKEGYLHKLIAVFSEEFKDNWIEKLQVDAKKNNEDPLFIGLKKLDDFERDSFIYLAKYILSGDSLNDPDDSLLKSLYNVILVDNNPKRTGDNIKDSLTKEFERVLSNLKVELDLVRSFVLDYIVRFDKVDSITNLKPVSKGNNSLFPSILESICKCCIKELNFRNSPKYLREIILYYENLNEVKKMVSGDDVTSIIDATLFKLNLLIEKLSREAKDHCIQYYRDNKLIQKRLEDLSQYSEDDFRRFFLLFYDIHLVDKYTIKSWLKELRNENVSMYKYALLMRYYVTQTKNINQIDELIELNDRHYQDTCKTDINKVDRYACDSMRNYMYNSRFSFLCHCKDYSLEKFRIDLEKIKSIQEETMIYSYIPYQDALDYLLSLINTKLEGYRIVNDIHSINSSQSQKIDFLKSLLEDVKHCYRKFKENVTFCKDNHPYLIQMRYKFSCHVFSDPKDKSIQIKVFCPSSFMGGVNYAMLQEQITEYGAQIPLIEYQVNQFDERQKLLNATNKIENIEKNMYEKLGLFASITTFLVGLLAIFIGNNGDVSIFTKMEYVIVLGSILALFVCIGGILLMTRNNTWKLIIFSLLAFGLLGIIGYHYYNRKESHNFDNETYERTSSSICADKIGPAVSSTRETAVTVSVQKTN